MHDLIESLPGHRRYVVNINEFRLIFRQRNGESKGALTNTGMRAGFQNKPG